MRGLANGLPADIRPLVVTFRDGVESALADNLIGLYLLGSVAFEHGGKHAGDIDFYVVTRREVNKAERDDLAALHRHLARTFDRGDDLDGLYLTLRQVRNRNPPRGIGFFADGRSRRHREGTWALHRAHLRRRACVPLAGPDPRTLFVAVSGSEIVHELNRELRLLCHSLERYPAYATLNLCRLVYTWRAGNPVVSKLEAATWARRHLPNEWRPLISAAVRVYRGRRTGSDVRLLGRDVPGFFEFVSEQVAIARRAILVRGSAQFRV